MSFLKFVSEFDCDVNWTSVEDCGTKGQEEVESCINYNIGVISQVSGVAKFDFDI